MSLAVRTERVEEITAGLRRLYPEADCELDFSNPLELTVATILSAQCTDKRVNFVTKPLFKRYKKAGDYASARPAELETMIRSTGFFRAKANSITSMAKTLVRDFDGKVPATMEELLRLKGVARKTANVVLGNAFGKAEGVVVDTHMKRLAYRMGLTDESDPVKVEKDLMACVPREDWIYFGHAMIWHGRRVCKALSPLCEDCTLRSICPQRGLE